MWVRVPFGRQKLVGINSGGSGLVGSRLERLKPILEVLDTRPVLDTAVLECCCDGQLSITTTRLERCSPTALPQKAMRM